jgi:hypothetical protein
MQNPLFPVIRLHEHLVGLRLHSVLVYDILINVLIQTSALVGPLYIVRKVMNMFV